MGLSRFDGKRRAVPKSSDDCGNTNFASRGFAFYLLGFLVLISSSNMLEAEVALSVYDLISFL